MGRILKVILMSIGTIILASALVLWAFPALFLYVAFQIFYSPISMDSARALAIQPNSKKIEMSCEREPAGDLVNCHLAFFKTEQAGASDFDYQISHAKYSTLPPKKNDKVPHYKLNIEGFEAGNELCRLKLGKDTGQEGAYDLAKYFNAGKADSSLKVRFTIDEDGFCERIAVIDKNPAGK